MAPERKKEKKKKKPLLSSSCCGVGRNCTSDLIPGWGTLYVLGRPKTKREKKPFLSACTPGSVVNVLGDVSVLFGAWREACEGCLLLEPFFHYSAFWVGVSWLATPHPVVLPSVGVASGTLALKLSKTNSCSQGGAGWVPATKCPKGPACCNAQRQSPLSLSVRDQLQISGKLGSQDPTRRKAYTRLVNK